MNSTNRERWIDVAKGLGILLVVYGHTVRGLVSAGILLNDGVVKFVDDFISEFHMPLFFMISGFFLVAGARRPWRSFLLTRFSRLGYPYVVWATFQTVLQIATGGSTNRTVSFMDLLRIPYAPPMQFWFIYVLLLHQILLAVLVKFGHSRTSILVLSLLFYFSGPFVSLGDWGVAYHIVLGVLIGIIGPLLLVFLTRSYGWRYVFSWPLVPSVLRNEFASADRDRSATNKSTFAK